MGQPRVYGVAPRYATAAEWAVSPLILQVGEEGVAWDTGVRKLGDGVSRWSQLPTPAAGGSVNLAPIEADVADLYARIEALSPAPTPDTPTDDGGWPDLRVWAEAAMQ